MKSIQTHSFHLFKSDMHIRDPIFSKIIFNYIACCKILVARH